MTYAEEMLQHKAVEPTVFPRYRRTPPRYVLVNASDWAVFLAPTITSYLSRGNGLAPFH
jgi:hypothetical protein